jgi:hypothetical protein
MNGVDSPCFMWTWGTIQVIGLLCGCVTRISEGSSRQDLSQCVFLGCMALVGISAMVALLTMGTGYWLGSAAALVAMTLTVTYDFRDNCQVQSYSF